MGNGNSKVTDQDRSILDLKLQRDKLRQYQKRIQVVLDREKEIAQQCLASGDKPRALLALRKRKYQQQLLLKTDSQLETLEDLARNIEFALVQKDVIYGLEQGNKVLKDINREMSIERVEKILDESAEGIEYQREVTELLSSRITNADEEEIQEELEALEREQLQKERGDLGKLAELPSAPKGTVVEPQREEVVREEVAVERPQPLLA
jgi:charged multivesicular body protein 6